jgi:hypothetical protein
MADVILESVLTCPKRGHAKQEVMPTTACQFFYVLRVGEVSADADSWLLWVDPTKKDGACQICGVKMATVCALLKK